MADAVAAEPEPKRPKVDQEGSKQNNVNAEGYMSEDEIDPADWIKYLKQVKASEGFDIDDFAPIIAQVAYDITIPMGPMETWEDKEVEMVFGNAKKAIAKFNDENGTNYEFVDVVKANYDIVAGYIFYITFLAKAADGGIETFQAKVYDGIPGDGESAFEIYFCRIKAKN
ncbi:hypothetical protein RJ640_030724 [Escallonia rubra]|uniref:Cystatin domain-containing protein n=1 Tax=Escallonia rubra TaxID=112253 RepID=A0AA88U5Q8_9ASTE|nr:hypothetical protein RJ640_030724 [Escallonia rubra]